MKKYFTLAGVTLLSIVSLCFGQTDMNKADKTKDEAKSQSSMDKPLIDREKAVWETVKNKQFDAFRKYVSDKYSGVYSDGVKDINREVDDVRNTDLKDYSLADIKVVLRNKDTAILSYKVTVQGSFKGQDISGVSYASSVWVNQSGKWLTILHTEVKAQ